LGLGPPLPAQLSKHSNRIVSAAVKDGTIAILYENLFADGSTTTGAGGMLVDDSGRICQIRTVSSAGTPMKPSDG